MAGSELPAIRLCSGQKTIIVVYKYGNRSTTPDYMCTSPALTLTVTSPGTADGPCSYTL